MSDTFMSSSAGSPPLTSGALLRPRDDPSPRESEPFETTSARAKVHVFLLCLGAFAASVGAAFVDGGHSRNWTAFVVLAVAAATAQLFGVHTTHNQSYHLAIVFVLAGALLLPPELVALLCVIQHLPEWIKERYPVEIQGFNIANYTLAALSAWFAAHLLLGGHLTGGDSRTALAGAGACLV